MRFQNLWWRRAPRRTDRRRGRETECGASVGARLRARRMALALIQAGDRRFGQNVAPHCGLGARSGHAGPPEPADVERIEREHIMMDFAGRRAWSAVAELF